MGRGFALTVDRNPGAPSRAGHRPRMSPAADERPARGESRRGGGQSFRNRDGSRHHAAPSSWTEGECRGGGASLAAGAPAQRSQLSPPAGHREYQGVGCPFRPFGTAVFGGEGESGDGDPNTTETSGGTGSPGQRGDPRPSSQRRRAPAGHPPDDQRGPVLGGRAQANQGGAARDRQGERARARASPQPLCERRDPAGGST